MIQSRFGDQSSSRNPSGVISKTPCVRIVVTLPFQLKQAVKDTHHGPLFP